MFLGLDIGTTATKAILIDTTQTVLGRAEAFYPTQRPAPGRSEQDPALWLAAVMAVLDDLRVTCGVLLEGVTGIGLSGQMHSLVTLGDDDAPLAPAILWNDGRGREECRLLEEAIPDIAELTGVMPMPSFTAAKLLWVRRHDPARFAAIRHILLPKDYVRLWLTGGRAVDVSDAAGSQLLDGAQRRWAVRVLDAIGLPTSCLPQLLESTEVAGALRPEAATRLGLPVGIPVAVGGGDAATGAVGLGCIKSGASFISLGTGATVVVAQDRFAPAPQAALHNFAHAVPGMWYQMAAMLNGASCLSWATRLVGEDDIPAMLDQVAKRYQGPSRILFLPYLTGERTPHNDTDIRASFVGLDAASDKVDLAQAVLEGVAFSLLDGCQALAAAGCSITDPGFIGGGARSLFWGRLIATVLGQPILYYGDADLGPAMGAARLGMAAATGIFIDEIARVPDKRTVIEPDLRLHERYIERHRMFQSIHRALQGLA